MIDLERALIGAAMLRPGSADQLVALGVESATFTHPHHQQAWTAVLALMDKGQALDVALVVDEMGAGASYTTVAGMLNSAASVGALASYAERILAGARKRKLLAAAADVSESMSVGQILSTLDAASDEAHAATVKDGPRSLSECVRAAYDATIERSKDPGLVTGLSTGYADLDEMLAGLHGSELIIVAARPGMGKSAFSMNIAAHAAIAQGARIAVFNLEMSRAELTTRLLISQARVDGHRVRTGMLREDDWSYLQAAATDLDLDSVHIDDTPAVGVGYIRSVCRRLHSRNALDLVVVDYLQLMQGKEAGRSREQEISSFSRGLKLLAKELDVPVVALSQLNRDCEKRTDKRPMLSDLRESGAIEQDADVVLFLYRDEVYNKDPDVAGLAECIVRKQRNGATGTVEMHWRKEHFRFETVDRSMRSSIWRRGA